MDFRNPQPVILSLSKGGGHLRYARFDDLRMLNWVFG